MDTVRKDASATEKISSGQSSAADSESISRIDSASIAADSHRGLVRRRNEDSYFYSLNHDGTRLIAAVADGIGGNENGDIASRVVMKMLLLRWRSFSAAAKELNAAIAGEFLRTTILEINEAIYSINLEFGSTHPMGSTIAVILCGPDWMVSAHAGDSRIYRLREGTLFLLTVDHSLVNELIQSGELTPEAAENHPYAHVITRSVGPTDVPNPEIQIFDHQPGDRYLLCSDGLTLHVGDEEIGRMLYDSFEPSQAVRNLMRMTLQRGARDNTTILSVFA